MAGGQPPPVAADSSQEGSSPAAGVDPANAVPTQNPNLAVAKGFPSLKEWAIANGIPQHVTATEREKIMGIYFDQQKSFLDAQYKQADPAYQTDLKLKQHELSTAPQKDQNLLAQTAESQSKVIQGELAKQQAMDAVNNQLADLQTQKENLEAVANHPELPNMTGMAGQYNPGITDAQRDLKARLEQISGQQLIGGINKIKDEASNPNGSLGMRITQQEALAVKNAVQRLQRYQDPATFASSATEAAGFLGKAIAAKQAQLARMPGVNTELLKQFNYSPGAQSSDGSTPGVTPAGSAATGAPVLRTVAGRTYQQNPATGGWLPIN